jgi:hypothetical protein
MNHRDGGRRCMKEHGERIKGEVNMVGSGLARVT